MNSLFKSRQGKNKASENNVKSCIHENDNQFRDFFLTGIHGKEYTIIDTISVKYNRGIYIIKKDNMKYILKIRYNEYINTFQKQIYSILNKYCHQNVIKYVEYYQDDTFFYVIHEYFEGINLFEYIKKNKILTDKQIKNIIIQIAAGTNFLHSYNIIHCDLKLDNVIINSKNEIQIIDFDLSIISDNVHGYVSDYIFGTMQYIAPESYDLCIYSKKTDVWQIGIILYILITKHFPHQNEITLTNSFSNLCRQNIFKHINLQLAKNIIVEKNHDEVLLTLLENALSFTDDKRMNIDDILKKLI